MTQSWVSRVFRSGFLLLAVLLFSAMGCTYEASQFGRIACDQSQPCEGDAICEDGFCVVDADSGDGDLEGLKCPEGQLECGDRCIDSQFDRSHCGECNRACQSQETCRDGDCQLFCGPGTQDCGDGTCTDIQSNSTHCGSCNSGCPGGQICRNGDCVDNCTSTEQSPTQRLQLCGDDCRDLDTDPMGCGNCATQCEAPAGAIAVCIDGECSFTCLPDLRNCGDRCINPEVTSCASE